VEVKVDPERCQGHTLCAMAAPDVFGPSYIDGHASAVSEDSLEWLSQHSEECDTLSREPDTPLNSATEEFLRYFAPAPGDGRTISADCEYDGIQLKERDRLGLSWAMANRDSSVFAEPNQINLERKGDRHFSFGVGMHQCIGPNVARTVFKRMLVAVLDRMPDHRCDPAGAVHYDSIGVIQGMRHLPATFTPDPRLSSGLDDTLEKIQQIADEQGLAEPITARGKDAQARG